MNSAPSLTKREEWARSWPLPVIAMLGITGPAAIAYTNGIFMEPMTREFAWTKTEFSSAMLLQMLFGLIILPIAARILDRVGSRRMLLAGILPFTPSLSVLGLAKGAIWQRGCCRSFSRCPQPESYPPHGWGRRSEFQHRSWHGDCRLFGGHRHCHGRLAVDCGKTGGFDWLAADLSGHGIFLDAAVAAIGLFFYRPEVQQKPLSVREMPPIGPSVRTPTFWVLVCAGGLFASVQFGLIVHLFPTVRLQGLNMAMAAGIVSTTGVFSILGRLCTGALLDWVPTKPLAIFAFLLPLPVMALLEIANGSAGLLMLAAALLGFAAGSGTDVVAYICLSVRAALIRAFLGRSTRFSR